MTTPDPVGRGSAADSERERLLVQACPECGHQARMHSRTIGCTDLAVEDDHLSCCECWRDRSLHPRTFEEATCG